MKTRLTLIAVLLLVFGVSNTFSQIPNNGFELWDNMGSYMNPQDWWSPNDSSAGAFP